MKGNQTWVKQIKKEYEQQTRVPRLLYHFLTLRPSLCNTKKKQQH